MKKHKRMLRWPADVPTATRRKLDGGTQVCGFRRLHSEAEKEAFDRQHVRLDRHLLAIVTTGNLLIERPEGGRWAKAGDAMLVLPGQIKLTEFPDYSAGSVDISYFLFSTRFIRNTFVNNSTIDFFAHQVYPAFSDIYVLENFVPRVMPVIRANPPDRAFATTIDYMVNGMFAIGFMFLKDAFFKPKRTLDLFLERYVGDPAGEANAALAYPGGAKALRRDSKIYTGMMPRQWLLKRRMQIARIWIRHGDSPLDEIAGALGYRTRSRFQDDYWEVHQRDYESEERLYNLRSMSQQDFVDIVTPFWHITEEKLSGTMETTEIESRRRFSHPEEFRRRRRKRSAGLTEDGGPSAPEGAAAMAYTAEVKADFASDASNEDEIQAPADPGLIVPDPPAVDSENPSSRESFACLKSTGAEVIYFPKIVAPSTTEEMAEHMRTTRMWDLVAA